MPHINTSPAQPSCPKQATLVALNAQYIHTPAGIYSLAAYAGHQLDLCCLSFNINEKFDLLLERIYHARAPIVCFSCYIWNIELVYRLAQALYAMDDSLCILLGGPEVSYDPMEQLRAHPYVAGILYGEGEKSFLQFVRTFYGTQDYSQLAGLCYRQQTDLIDNGPPELIPAADIPVPYDFAQLPSPPQIIYYESSRGCPHRCAFCLSRGEALRLRPLEDTLMHLRQFVEHGAKQVKLIDRSFNADLDRAKRIWKELATWDTDCNFHFEVAAASLDEEALAILQRAPKGRFQFEIGVQSTNPNTKRAIDRPESFQVLQRVVRSLQSQGNLHLHLDLIAGLPEEDMASFGQSFRDVFALRPDMLQLGFLKLLKGSQLRSVAAEFGCHYSEQPPYEVRRTSTMRPEDFFVLKRCERALDLYYHAPPIKRATLHLLGQRDSFAFFCELGAWIGERNLSSLSLRMEALWCFAVEKGWQSPALRERMLYDVLTWERTPTLPLGFAPPSSREKEKIRLFYQTQGAKLFPQAKGNPWRFSQVQGFAYDIFHDPEQQTPALRKNYVLFDYQNKRQMDITAFML